MKKLCKRLLLFVFTILVFLFILPVDRRMQFAGLDQDCANHAIWIYDRIHHNPKPMDLVFLGSSRSINGIDDEFVEHKLADKNINVANLAYCRLGRNLSYLMLKELLKKKQPRYLVLEVREDEDRYSHPVFPYLASSKEILQATPFFNRDLLSDAIKHLVYKSELICRSLFEKSAVSVVQSKDFGF